MNDLISRQAALDNAWQVMYKDEWHMTQTEQVVSVNDIEALPAIDAVPVVRCKECRFSVVNENIDRKPLICGKTKMCGETTPDWFCAAGERSKE